MSAGLSWACSSALLGQFERHRHSGSEEPCSTDVASPGFLAAPAPGVRHSFISPQSVPSRLGFSSQLLSSCLGLVTSCLARGSLVWPNTQEASVWFLCHPFSPSPSPQPPGGCLRNSATRCLARALPPGCGRGPGVTVSGPLAALAQPMVAYSGWSGAGHRCGQRWTSRLRGHVRGQFHCCVLSEHASFWQGSGFSAFQPFSCRSLLGLVLP